MKTTFPSKEEKNVAAASTQSATPQTAEQVPANSASNIGHTDAGGLVHRKFEDTTGKEIVVGRGAIGGAIPAAPVEDDKEAPLDRNTMVSLFSNEKVEVDNSDIVVPRLNLVQGIGPLSALFSPGELVGWSETVLAKPEAPAKDGKPAVSADVLEVVVVNIRKGYEQKLTAQERKLDIIPGSAHTVEDVARKGGTTIWNESREATNKDGTSKGYTTPYYGPVANLLVLIKKPASLPDNDLRFQNVIEEGAYDLFIWKVKSLAYTAVATKVFTAIKTTLQGEPANGLWNLSVTRKEKNGNLVWIPEFKNVGRTSAELKALAISIRG